MKMKILHVINSLRTGGAEKLLVDLVVWLREKDIRVEVAVLNGEETPLLERLREECIKVYILSEGKRAEYSPLHVFRLRSLLDSYDIVHVHLFPAQYWGALASVLSSRHPLMVTTEHSTYNTRCKYRLTSWIDKMVYARYDAVICISRAVVQMMRKKVRGVKLCQVDNGIRTQVFKMRREADKKALGLGDDVFLLLQVARFQEEKDQDSVIRALGFLPKNIHVAFAGEGERLESCKQLALEEGVMDRTHFLGVRNDIPALWALADVGVMSSHWEGFGLAAVEGMASGKPVVVSRVEGLADVVGDKRLQFTPSNPRDLADKILSLYGDADLMEELAQYCLERSSRYDISAMAEGYLSLYTNLLKERYEEERQD